MKGVKHSPAATSRHRDAPKARSARPAAGRASGSVAAGDLARAVKGVKAAKRPARRPAPAAAAAAERARPALPALGADPRAAVAATVVGLGYDVIDVERAGRGLLRVTIDRRPGRAYAEPGEAVTVGDCETVTRQLQYALEVDGVDYARLEVSSPGLDRPLRTAADFERFAGLAVNLTLKQPFGGRKHFQGLLGRGEAEGGFTLQFNDGKAEQVLGFALDEVREARLVPVVDFKGRRAPQPAAGGTTAAANDEVNR